MLLPQAVAVLLFKLANLSLAWVAASMLLRALVLPAAAFVWQLVLVACLLSLLVRVLERVAVRYRSQAVLMRKVSVALYRLALPMVASAVQCRLPRAPPRQDRAARSRCPAVRPRAPSYAHAPLRTRAEGPSSAWRGRS